MEHVIFVMFVILISSLFALVEIQVEGAFGWAEKLPTWKLESKVTKVISGGKPLTGYHLFLLLFIIVFAHMPYGLGLVFPAWWIELRIISLIILFFVFEDFLWFALNPAFGLKRFKPEHIWWHADVWWWIMPREYWIFTPIGVACYILSWSAGF